MRPRFNAVRLAALFAAASLLSPTWAAPLSAQTPGDSSRVTLDIIGLHRWTPVMLRDSLRKFRPGAEIGDAACMALLRTNLGFPDASVTNLIMSPTNQYLVVKVVEPGDEWRSKWREIRTPANWHGSASYDSVIAVMTNTTGTLEAGLLVPALQLYKRTPDQRRARMEKFSERQRVATNTLWHLLESEQTPAGFEDAARVVRSGTESQRMLAAAVLGQFPDRNDAWEELIVVLRDPSPIVRIVADIALTSMPVRAIPWRGHSISSLRALLGGTNVDATELVQRMLVQTAITPTMAAPLLRGNGDWLLMHLAATNTHSSGLTRAFLTYMNRGVDVGSAEQWAGWIARL